jgi:hypothetical protein
VVVSDVPGAPEASGWWTACKTSRRTRLREPRRQSRPGKEEEGGWSSAQRRFASVEEGCIDFLQSKRSREVGEERWIKRESIEEEVGAREHRGRRIRAEKPTGPADLR